MITYFVLGFFAAWVVDAVWSYYCNYKRDKELTAFAKQKLKELKEERLAWEVKKEAWRQEDESYYLGRATESIKVGDLVTIKDGQCKKSNCN